MKTTVLFAASLVLYAAAARAQSIEDAAAAARSATLDFKRAVAEERLAAAARAEAARVFPVKLVCKPAKDSGLPKELTFFTRLGADVAPASLKERPVTVAAQFSPLPGESATALDDYRAISIGREDLKYDLWSCDTQDYFFRFAVKDLARDPALQETRRPIKARVKIETRGATDYVGELPCEAIYQDRPSA